MIKWYDRLLFVLAIVVLVYVIHENQPKEQDNSILINHIDSLSKRKDSINIQINKVDSTIYNNKTIYAKERNTIIKQSSDSDMLFFTNYIQEVGRRLLIDTVSVENN